MHPAQPSRRSVVLSAAAAAAGLAVGCLPTRTQPAGHATPSPGPLFPISLAQWSLHRAIEKGDLKPLEFPRASKDTYGIDAVEYVNSFYKPLLPDSTAVAPLAADLNRRCADAGVRSLLIMCDGEGDLGDPDDAARARAVDNHKKWAELAAALRCHSIRVNAASKGTPDEQQRLAADGLRRLTEFCTPLDLFCIVENHGGLSSHGDWLAGVMKRVDHPRVGTLPDFGNFYGYDRYKGVHEMMPFARGVSAKSHDFDDFGNETRTDYRRMLTLVLQSGYRGHVGIEYEGEHRPEPEGIRLTKRLLERTRDALSADFR